MKAKKLILLSILSATDICHAVSVCHTMISIAEHKLLGHVFKHVMKSGGTEKDEFFIDGYAASQADYYAQLERLEKKEREEESLRQQAARRSRIEFADKMQVEIAAKLLQKVLTQIAQLFGQIYNPALEKFFIFTDKTIHSQDQLAQLKVFTEQLDESVQNKIEENDFEGLHLLYTKLEFWPVRLEKFFQDTVYNAIKKSDDTSMLKELLKLVSESSVLN